MSFSFYVIIEQLFYAVIDIDYKSMNSLIYLLNISKSAPSLQMVDNPDRCLTFLLFGNSEIRC